MHWCEEKAKRCYDLFVKRCVVSYVDSEGLRHSVEVNAESLYEAAVLLMRDYVAGRVDFDALIYILESVARAGDILNAAVNYRKQKDWRADEDRRRWFRHCRN